MPNIGGRLRRIERAMCPRAEKPCSGCGYVPGREPTVTIVPGEVVKHIAEVQERVANRTRDCCRVCKRQLVFRIPSPAIRRADDPPPGHKTSASGARRS
jgi:hypothetical protein